MTRKATVLHRKTEANYQFRRPEQNRMAKRSMNFAG
jgi:hypothetical protein